MLTAVFPQGTSGDIARNTASEEINLNSLKKWNWVNWENKTEVKIVGVVLIINRSTKTIGWCNKFNNDINYTTINVIRKLRITKWEPSGQSRII